MIPFKYIEKRCTGGYLTDLHKRVLRQFENVCFTKSTVSKWSKRPVAYNYVVHCTGRTNSAMDLDWNELKRFSFGVFLTAAKLALNSSSTIDIAAVDSSICTKRAESIVFVILNRRSASLCAAFFSTKSRSTPVCICEMYDL